MNKKVLLQDLSERMAQRKGLTRKDADLFVRSVFEVIGEYLQTDKIVKVKGLGTFKLVTVESRASVDVNTGERIVIKGYTKVSFTPDAVLRDEINKPFAQFETVVLNEGTDVDEMERVEAPELPELPTTESIEDVAEVAEPVLSSPVGDAPDFDEEKVEEEETADEEMPVEGGVVETAAIEEEALECETENQAVEPEVMPLPEENRDTVANDETVGQPKPESTPESPVEKEVHVASQQVEFQKVEHQTVENQHIVQVAPEYTEGRRALSVWAWTSICLAVLLLMCGSYYAGHRHWFCPGDCRNEAVVMPRKDKVKKPVSSVKKETENRTDSVQVRNERHTGVSEKTVRSVSEASRTTYPQVEGGRFEIVGTKGVHQLKPGETLRGLALKYYGSKEYVDYIIVHNEIKNPDIVPVNMELKLPELTLKRR